MTADELRAILTAAHVTIARAGRALDLNERTMRRYCAHGKWSKPIPRVVELAVRYLYASVSDAIAPHMTKIVNAQIDQDAGEPF